MNQNIRWQEVLNKRAIGIDKCDLGKVEQINDDIIITKKGLINKSRYLMPKKLVDRFDGNMLYFKIMKAEARQFRQNHNIIRNNVNEKLIDSRFTPQLLGSLASLLMTKIIARYSKIYIMAANQNK